MAAEYVPGSDSPSTSDKASKVILRMSLIEGCTPDQNTTTHAMHEAVRKLIESTEGKVIISEAEKHAILFGVSGTTDIKKSLATATLIANEAIMKNMLPYEIDAARISENTFNVSAVSVWRNLSLDKETDATAEVLALIEEEQGKMWEQTNTIYSIGGPKEVF